MPSDSWTSKAEWLIAMVESGGRWGTVINYDGTAMTAGLHQAIAIYPRNPKKQGSLWRLLAQVIRDEAAEDMRRMIANAGWELKSNGVLTEIGTDKIVDGRQIALEFTGSLVGNLSREVWYKKACEWALTFHKLFSHPNTYAAQREFGHQWIQAFLNRRVGDKKILKYFEDNRWDCSYIKGEWIPYIEMELAFCVLCSHSVNAPAIAMRKFRAALRESRTKVLKRVDRKRLARTLIRKLGDTKYGRWDDDLKNGRYQRTRKFAKRIFPARLFEAKGIMPKDL
jgi:hypothetical protein